MPRERKGVSKQLSGIQETRRYFVIASEGADTERAKTVTLVTIGASVQVISDGSEWRKIN